MQPTAQEQELLELVNRLRLDPAGEVAALIRDPLRGLGATTDITRAIDYFNVDLGLFTADMESRAAVAPLAWNAALASAAETHSARMIMADLQSHQLPGEASLGSRIAAAGYDGLRAWGENIFAYAEDVLYAHAGFVIDWGYGPGGMQNPAGHRNILLDARYTEIGIGILADTDPATRVGPLVVTQDLGARNAPPVLLGVVIDDADGDRFYDAGEGMGGVTVTVTGTGGRHVTTTWAAGGYQIALPAGSYTVTFSGGGLDGVVTREIRFGQENLKIDALAADARALVAALRGTAGNDVLAGGAAAETILGLAGDDWITPGGGKDSIDGGTGTDMLSLSTLSRGATVDIGAGTALSGTDTLRLVGIEGVTGSVHADVIKGDAGANRLRGLGGYDWFLGSGGADSLDGGAGVDMMSYVLAGGGVVADLARGRGLGGQALGDSYAGIEGLTGSGHADRLWGNGGGNQLRGLGGNDILAGRGGWDRLDGGAGLDIAVYAGTRADYRLSFGTDSLTVTDLAGLGEGTDRLIAIEILRFADGDVIL